LFTASSTFCDFNLEKTEPTISNTKYKMNDFKNEEVLVFGRRPFGICQSFVPEGIAASKMLYQRPKNRRWTPIYAIYIPRK